MSVEEKRRELFEIWFARDPARKQANASVKCMWWVVWNAALDVVVIELPISNFPDGCGDIYEAIEIDSMREAIESTGLGLKVKS